MNSLIQKKSLANEVADRLQQQILTGHYKTGEKLPIEPELMKSFGVGRSTIREAVKILANLGLLKVQQGVGTFVDKPEMGREPIDQRLKRAKAHDLDEVRQLLEVKIAEKAAINRTEADILQMRQHLANRKAAADAGLLTACIAADVSFHVAIAEASKNDILTDLYKLTSVHLSTWFLHIYKTTAAFVETQHLHEQLLNNIIAGDAKKAWNTAMQIIGHVSQ